MNSSLFALFFLLELVSLFFLSSALSRSVSLTLFRITKNAKASIKCLAILFLPGVILHEMSHYLTANLLGVRTGRVEFMPEVNGDSVKLGSVEVAHTDILRRSIIGVAPLLLGLLSLYAISYFSSLVVVSWETIKLIIVYYSMFLIGNTMFSSRKDMEGVWIFLLIIGILTGLLVYFFRTESVYVFTWIISQQQFFLTTDKLLLIPIGIDILVVCLLKLLRRHV